MIHLRCISCVFWSPCAWFIASPPPNDFPPDVFSVVFFVSPVRVPSFCAHSVRHHVSLFLNHFISSLWNMSVVSRPLLPSPPLNAVCVCSSGAARWPAAESEMETGRFTAGFLLQGNNNTHHIPVSFMASPFMSKHDNGNVLFPLQLHPCGDWLL